MAGKPIRITALRGAHEAQIPPRLGVRIVVVAVLLQLLLLAALLMLFGSRANAVMPRSKSLTSCTPTGLRSTPSDAASD